MSTDTVYLEIPVEDLHDSPTNPRQVFDDASLAELATDIKAHGRVLQPLLVRPRVPALFAGVEGAQVGYEIVFGHRRKRGAVLAGLPTVTCMVRTMTDAEVEQAQISENLQRRDVHPFEEAAGYASMIERHGETRESLAERFGKSRSYIYGRLKLLEACPTVRKACVEGRIGAEVALYISRLRTEALQTKALARIEAKFLRLEDGGVKSTRQIRELLIEEFTLDLKTAIFQPGDETLIPAVGACTICPRRSGCAPEFADMVADRDSAHGAHYKLKGNADACTDPDCYAAKKTAHLKREAEALRAAGQVVIDGHKARAAVGAAGDVKGDYVALKAVKGQLATLSKAAKKGEVIATPAIVTIQDPRTGTLHQAVRVADLTAAGVSAKPAPSRAASGTNWAAEQREREASAEALRQARRAELLRIRAAMGGTERTAAEARVVARVMVCHLVEDDEAAELAKLWGVDLQNSRRAAADSPWIAAIDAMAPAEVAQLMCDCALMYCSLPNMWELTSIAVGLEGFAALHPVDAAALPTPSTAAQAQELTRDKGEKTEAPAGAGACQSAWPWPGEVWERKKRSDDAGVAAGGRAAQGSGDSQPAGDGEGPNQTDDAGVAAGGRVAQGDGETQPTSAGQEDDQMDNAGVAAGDCGAEA